ncbi:MAG: hypothetical protein E7348_03725 [Clostridiales bacterium]|nr:hypothetical protein [Clostridiales bacterium]
MTERLKIIFDHIPNCDIFADIGCDHGYIAYEMLKSNKANKVIISDISQKCLLKAQELLSPFISQGRAVSVVSDGFDKVGACSSALIAGMGGEEICSILTNAKSLPDSLVLQPMKNTDKVRRLVVEKGYKIVKDFIFKSSGKFYDLMVLEKGEDSLTQNEIEFGRDNINGNSIHFKEFIKQKIGRLEGYLESQNLSNQDREKMQKEKERLSKYV